MVPKFNKQKNNQNNTIKIDNNPKIIENFHF